jgi:multisubunit Na+/H+ antiporter MnhB subunit
VNVILVDFRGIDTMGEITVLAAAAIGSVALARAGRRPRPARRATAVDQHGVTRLVVVDVAVRLVFSAVMVGSIYLLFAGHNQPGGGFVGGIVAGAAVALRYVAGGIDDVRNLSRAHPWTVLGTGLVLSAVTVLTPVLLGSAPLESATFETDLPLLGHVKVTSALAFDAGVYLVVLGLVLMMFESFGDAPHDVVEPGELAAPAETHAPTEAGAGAVPDAAEVAAR